MDLHVGSLPFKINENALRELFEAHGQVLSVKIIIDKRTGQSKGYGFVQMADDTEAETAIEKLHGSELHGRHISVQKSQPNTKVGPANRPAGYRTKQDLIAEKYAELKASRKNKWEYGPKKR